MSLCTVCKEDKPVSEFGKGQRADGTNSYCRPCYNAYKRRHYAKNREKEVARSHKWNQENRDRFNENARKSSLRPHRKPVRQAYIEKNKDKFRIYDLNKHHKRRDSGERKSDIRPEQWFSILEAIGHRCFYCLRSGLKLCMDHFVPLSKGGRHCIENLVPACKHCNGSKWSNMPMDFMKKIGRA